MVFVHVMEAETFLSFIPILYEKIFHPGLHFLSLWGPVPSVCLAELISISLFCLLYKK